MFMSQLRETNASLGFFADFGKIAANVESVAIKLNQKLEEAFYSIPCIYNLTTIDEFVRLVKAENGMRQ